MALVIAPHNDDEALFAAFTIQRERAHVLIVYDGIVQGMRGLKITPEERRAESIRACFRLQAEAVWFLGLSDASLHPPELYRRIGEWFREHERNHGLSFSDPAIYYPAVEDSGHHHHNAVGKACRGLFPAGTEYLTYTVAGKSTNGTPVPFTGEMVVSKLRALAEYRSQLERAPDCLPHFVRSLEEFYATTE